MKKIIQSFLFILLFLITFELTAQIDTILNTEMPTSIYEVCKPLNDDTVLLYYNSRYQLVRPECAEIFRKVKINTEIAFFDGNFIDFSVDSIIILTGSYIGGKKEGYFSFYYPNGQISASGKYFDDKKIGIWNYWYENGQNLQTLEFVNNDTLITEFWDENNVKLVEKGNGNWYFYEYPNKFTKIQGKLLNGKKNGKWKKTIPSEHCTINVEKYREGEFLTGKFITIYDVSERYKDNTYCIIEPILPFITAEYFKLNRCYILTKNDWKYAKYPSGEIGFYEEIKNKFIYPEEAYEVNKKGTIIIQITIDINGEMTNFKNVSTLGYGLEEELIRVMRTMRKWVPAYLNGEPRIQTKLIRFTIL